MASRAEPSLTQSLSPSRAEPSLVHGNLRAKPSRACGAALGESSRAKSLHTSSASRAEPKRAAGTQSSSKSIMEQRSQYVMDKMPHASVPKCLLLVLLLLPPSSLLLIHPSLFSLLSPLSSLLSPLSSLFSLLSYGTRRTDTDAYGCPSDPYGSIRMPVWPGPGRNSPNMKARCPLELPPKLLRGARMRPSPRGSILDIFVPLWFSHGLPKSKKYRETPSKSALSSLSHPSLLSAHAGIYTPDQPPRAAAMLIK